MKIPSRKNIYKTGDEDPIFLHYWPVVGYVYRKRLRNTLSFLKNSYNNLLDIGYGSGLLFPELSGRANKVYGVEIHNQENLVYKMLTREGINNIELKSGSIYDLPFKDKMFDCIVSISTLEHLDNLSKAMLEINRVAKNEADIILSFPVRNNITDLFYKWVGYNPRHIHPSSHRDIIKTVGQYFEIKQVLNFPSFKNTDKALYCTIKCNK